MTTGRAFLGFAILALAAVLVLGVIPNPGTAVEYDPWGRVNCGTLFVDTGYAGDEGCEDTHAIRSISMLLLWLVALLAGAIGLIVLRHTVVRS